MAHLSPIDHIFWCMFHGCTTAGVELYTQEEEIIRKWHPDGIVGRISCKGTHSQVSLAVTISPRNSYLLP